MTLPELGCTGASLEIVINNLQFSMGFHMQLSLYSGSDSDEFVSLSYLKK